MGLVVDTNVLVRLITGDPAVMAQRAGHELAAANDGSWLVDRIIAAEVLYVLRANYGYTKQEALSSLQALLGIKAFAFIDTGVCLKMLQIMHTSSLAPADACLAALVLSGAGDGAYTFDDQLAKYIARHQ